MSTSAIDAILRDGVALQDIPFVVAMSATADGVSYSGCAGPASQGRAASDDTVFRIFSATKAIGAFAAMVLIDRGLLSMDTPVAEILPAWTSLQVLDGWDGETPIMRQPKTAATIRHLATHRSGLAYEYWSADTARYLAATGSQTVFSGTQASLCYPLTHDPGERWSYGPGIDWLGQVIEAVDGRRIDQFCTDEIFAPLGMADTVFEPDGRADRMADVWSRGRDGGFDMFNIAPVRKPEIYGMGHCLYSTASDYIKFLRMILNGGVLDGHRLLSEGAFAIMVADQMEGHRVQNMETGKPRLTADVLFPESMTHSFISCRSEVDLPGRRKAGSQSWAGICNTHYWVDPASDIAGVFFTQSLPFVEPRFLRVYEAFEAAVYAG